MPKKTFESAMKRLEEIVTELESGSLSLEDSLKIYEEGMELTQFCTTKLDETEKKVKELYKQGNEFKLKSLDL